MATKQEILAELTAAEGHIATAKQMVDSTGTPAPIPPPSLDYVEVNPGDNIMQMIQDHAAGTKFHLHDEFVQDCGIEAAFPKPCTLFSKRATLIGIFYAIPNMHFIGMTLNGANSNTILTGADNVKLDACTLNGNVGGQHRGILANCRGMRIRNTKILNIAKDQDTQAILGTNYTDDLEVLGCQLEASGENILFGGDTSVSEAAIPKNIKIKGCLVTKKLEWKDNPATCKNLIEIKQGTDIEITDNVLEYSFVDGQTGYAFVLTVRNEYGQSPWATIRNLRIENNHIQHVAGAFHLLGRDDRGSNYPSQIMNNVLIKNNRIDDMSWEWGGNGRQIFITGGPDKVTFDGNEFDCPTLQNSALSFDKPKYLVTDLVIKNQMMVDGEYGIIGTSSPGLGTPALEMYAPGYKWENNTIKIMGGNPYVSWPAGTSFI